MKKYIKDNKVAILYSPDGYWSTYYDDIELRKKMIFSYELIKMIIENKLPDDSDFEVQDKMMSDLFGIDEWDTACCNEIHRLKIRWIDINDKFTIGNNRGEFVIILIEDVNFFIA